MRAMIIPLAAVGLAACAHAQEVSPEITWRKGRPTAPQRSELHDSATPLAPLPAPSPDPAHRTPLPVERPGEAAHLPEGFEVVVPFEGSHAITNGYGYESAGWTHSTIGNQVSANDFFALDFAMPEGTPIRAAAAGRVVTSNLRSDSYGHYVVIDHGDGLSSVYAHLSTREFEVMHGSPEVWVEAGQRIGLSGESGTSAGPHLHFAMHRGATRSASGADVGGLAVCPEPMGGLHGLREGHVLEGR